MKSTVYRRGKILYAREFYFKRKKRPIFLILMIPLYSSSKNSSVCSRYSHGSTVTSAMNNIYYIHNKIVLSPLMPLKPFLSRYTCTYNFVFHFICIILLIFDVRMSYFARTSLLRRCGVRPSSICGKGMKHLVCKYLF